MSFNSPSDRSIPTVIFVLFIALTGKGINGLFRKSKPPALLIKYREESHRLLDDQKMYFSKATVVDIMEIPKISRKVAEAIVAFRNQKGAIHSLDELDSIPGIGPKTMERLKQYLILQ